MKTTIVLAVALLALPVKAQETPPTCTFDTGALPADTLPAGAPHGSAIPINHVIVLMQENRSFDHYFGQLHFQGKRRSEAEPRNASNPNPLGGDPITAFHRSESTAFNAKYCEVSDLDHSWDGSHREWNGGAMDGFTTENADPDDPTGSRAMGYYNRKDLNFYYILYKKFATADRYFCSALTQTFPNRFYLLAATSFGRINNGLPMLDTDYAPANGTIFEQLDAAGITWKVYYAQIAFAQIFAYVRNTRQANLAPIAQYFLDLQTNALPQVAFIDPIFLGPTTVENDEHPPADVQVGQKFVADVVKAFVASPYWGDSAFFLTYDEHGGYYDHVPPPPACHPDGIPPMLGPSNEPGDFDRLGFRVPFVLVSPFSRRHFVSHTVYDHTSILRFIETRFDLPALTARDANADPMLELFDFRRARFRRPPKLPDAIVDPDELVACMNP